MKIPSKSSQTSACSEEVLLQALTQPYGVSQQAFHQLVQVALETDATEEMKILGYMAARTVVHVDTATSSFLLTKIIDEFAAADSPMVLIQALRTLASLPIAMLGDCLMESNTLKMISLVQCKRKPVQKIAIPTCMDITIRVIRYVQRTHTFDSMALVGENGKQQVQDLVMNTEEIWRAILECCFDPDLKVAASAFSSMKVLVETKEDANNILCRLCEGMIEYCHKKVIRLVEYALLFPPNDRAKALDFIGDILLSMLQSTNYIDDTSETHFLQMHVDSIDGEQQLLLNCRDFVAQVVYSKMLPLISEGSSPDVLALTGVITRLLQHPLLKSNALIWIQSIFVPALNLILNWNNYEAMITQVDMKELVEQASTLNLYTGFLKIARSNSSSSKSMESFWAVLTQRVCRDITLLPLLSAITQETQNETQAPNGNKTAFPAIVRSLLLSYDKATSAQGVNLGRITLPILQQYKSMLTSADSKMGWLYINLVGKYFCVVMASCEDKSMLDEAQALLQELGKDYVARVDKRIQLNLSWIIVRHWAWTDEDREYLPEEVMKSVTSFISSDKTKTRAPFFSQDASIASFEAILTILFTLAARIPPTRAACIKTLTEFKATIYSSDSSTFPLVQLIDQVVLNIQNFNASKPVLLNGHNMCRDTHIMCVPTISEFEPPSSTKVHEPQARARAEILTGSSDPIEVSATFSSSCRSTTSVVLSLRVTNVADFAMEQIKIVMLAAGAIEFCGENAATSIADLQPKRSAMLVQELGFLELSAGSIYLTLHLMENEQRITLKLGKPCHVFPWHSLVRSEMSLSMFQAHYERSTLLTHVDIIVKHESECRSLVQSIKAKCAPFLHVIEGGYLENKYLTQIAIVTRTAWDETILLVLSCFAFDGGKSRVGRLEARINAPAPSQSNSNILSTSPESWIPEFFGALVQPRK